MALSDVDVDGVDLRVEAGPVFIRRAANTPGGAAVCVANNAGASDLGEVDEVVAMVRVRSAGGTESSQAIFKSEQTHSADV
jgi:hypothetical protein